MHVLLLHFWAIHRQIALKGNYKLHSAHFRINFTLTVIAHQKIYFILHVCTSFFGGVVFNFHFLCKTLFRLCFYVSWLRKTQILVQKMHLIANQILLESERYLTDGVKSFLLSSRKVYNPRELRNLLATCICFIFLSMAIF